MITLYHDENIDGYRLVVDNDEVWSGQDINDEALDALATKLGIEFVYDYIDRTDD